MELGGEWNSQGYCFILNMGIVLAKIVRHLTIPLA